MPVHPAFHRAVAAGLIAAGLLAAVTGLAAPAHAAEVSLRPEARVDARMVRLSDLFNGVPASQDAKILTAPRIGQTIRLSGKRLEGIATRHDLDWTSSNGQDIELTREIQRIRHDRIESAVIAALRREGVSQALTISLHDQDLDLALPATAPATLRIEDLNYRPRNHRFTATVAAPAEGKTLARTTVTGRAVEMLELPVPARRIDRGEIIREGDVEWITRAADTLRRRHVETLDALVGKAAQRSLRAGQPIRSSAVAAPILIDDGALVTIKVRSRHMTLTARGRALEDGAAGETIRVENTTSKKTVTGTVGKDGTVHVDADVLPMN
mgnify:CR=1 FL=1